VAGSDRYSTAAATSADAFPYGADVVFIVTGESYPDALAAGAASGGAGPVLLVRHDDIPSSTAQELARLAPATIVLVGGEAAVSQAVEARLRTFTADVVRFAGSNRYATAAAIAVAAYKPAQGYGPIDVIYVASGRAFPDALTGATAAGAAQGPLLLTEPTSLPTETSQAITDLGGARSIVVIGGSGAVSDSVFEELRGFFDMRFDPLERVQRVAAADRYATAAEISRRGFGLLDTVYVASGANFPDALAGSAPAAGLGAPMLLVPPSGEVPHDVACELHRIQPSDVVILGGTAALPASVEGQLLSAMSADPGGCTPPSFVRTYGHLRDVVVTDDGKLAYATSPALGLIEVFDLTTGAELDPIEIGCSHSGIDITPDGTRLYVTDAEVSKITRVDIATGTLEVLGFPSPNIAFRAVELAIAADGIGLFWAGEPGTTSGFAILYQLDTNTDSIVRVTAYPYGDQWFPHSSAIVASADRSVVGLITHSASSTIDVYHAATGTFTRAFTTLPQKPFYGAVSEGGRYGVSTAETSGSPSRVFDLAEGYGHLVSTIQDGAGGFGLAARGGVGYRATSNSLQEFALPGGEITGTFELGDLVMASWPLLDGVGQVELASTGPVVVITNHGLAILRV
jgi:putative cell wall-binding protein